MSRDFRFSGLIGDNECIDVLVSDILTLAYEVDRFGGGGSVMVWGGISHGVKTPLVVIQGNLSRTLSGSGAYASRPPACQCS